MESGMLPGHRFYPTEEELVSFYLHNKLEGKRQDLNQVVDMIIPVLDIYDFNPWDLPQYSGELCKKDPEQWFFFIPRQESEARGGRPRRLTSIGYWKATGSPGCIYSDNRSIGLKRTMVFYRGRAPNGQKTEWKMNEYKAIQEDASSESTAPPKLRDEFSLCRVYKNSKQLRAFDRRPLGVEVRGMRAQQVPEEAPSTFTMESHQIPPVMERTSSSQCQSSSSGDHDNNVPSQAQDISNLAMPFDSDELPCDWELCWFHGGENSQLN